MPICIVHNIDTPDALQKFNIERFKPDYYIQRPNIGQDIGAFMDIINNKQLNWDVLYWFADDMIPMCKNFLDNFKIEPGVGVVGHHRTTWNVRTCAFSISRDAANDIGYKEIRTREDCLSFETHPGNMTQVLEAKGHKVKAAHCPDPGQPGHEPVYYENYSNILWDSHYAANLNLWSQYDLIFGKGYKLPLLL